jgi:hypothetical protein
MHPLWTKLYPISGHVFLTVLRLSSLLRYQLRFEWVKLWKTWQCWLGAKAQAQPNHCVPCLFPAWLRTWSKSSRSYWNFIKKTVIARSLPWPFWADLWESAQSLPSSKDSQTNDFHTDFPKGNQNIGLLLNRMAYLLPVSLFFHAKCHGMLITIRLFFSTLEA